jgi:hypothetical protein
LEYGLPASLSRAAARYIAREVSPAAGMSASRKPSPWCSMMGTPKVSRAPRRRRPRRPARPAPAGGSRTGRARSRPPRRSPRPRRSPPAPVGTRRRAGRRHRRLGVGHACPFGRRLDAPGRSLGARVDSSDSGQPVTARRPRVLAALSTSAPTTTPPAPTPNARSPTTSVNCRPSATP